jgi:LSD1 subclass zinc finger protein
MLADLRNVRIPSLDPDAGGRGIDLHFVTRTVTLLPVEDSEQSTAFMKLLRTAKIPANVGEHLDTSAEGGAKLLLLKCDHCAKMQGVREDDESPSCSSCGEPLDVDRGKEAGSDGAAEKKHVECGVCGQWLRYPHGVKEVMCTCGAVLQIGGGASEGVEFVIDPEVLAKVVEMRARCVIDRKIIRSLSCTLDELKERAAARNITPAMDSALIKRVKNPRKGVRRSASAFAMSSSTGGGLGAPLTNMLRKDSKGRMFGRKKSSSMPEMTSPSACSQSSDDVLASSSARRRSSASMMRSPAPTKTRT